MWQEARLEAVHKATAPGFSNGLMPHALVGGTLKPIVSARICHCFEACFKQAGHRAVRKLTTVCLQALAVQCTRNGGGWIWQRASLLEIQRVVEFFLQSTTFWSRI